VFSKLFQTFPKFFENNPIKGFFKVNPLIDSGKSPQRILIELSEQLRSLTSPIQSGKGPFSKMCEHTRRAVEICQLNGAPPSALPTAPLLLGKPVQYTCTILKPDLDYIEGEDPVDFNERDYTIAVKVKVKLKWVRPFADGGAEIREFFVYAQAGRDLPFTKIQSISPTFAEIELTDLLLDVPYRFSVTSVNEFGESELSPASLPISTGFTDSIDEIPNVNWGLRRSAHSLVNEEMPFVIKKGMLTTFKKPLPMSKLKIKVERTDTKCKGCDELINLLEYTKSRCKTDNKMDRIIYSLGVSNKKLTDLEKMIGSQQ
jgi:hypothetical protein